MHTWTWQTWQGKAFVTCDLLAAWPHGFFTHQFSPETPEALVHALNPEAAVYRTKQVHGNVVLSPTDIEVSTKALAATADQGASHQSLEPPQADGSFSQEALQSVWVCSADCTPALIGDVRTGQVAAVHAGWRGTAQKIIPIAIQKLQAQGTQLADVRVALGPAIAGEVYQVGTDVAAEVGASLLDAFPLDSLDGPALVDRLKSMEQPPILEDDAPACVRLDVRRINELQLLQMGVTADQIAIAPHCTYQQPEYFFSYRRTKERKVQWSGIVSQ